MSSSKNEVRENHREHFLSFSLSLGLNTPSHRVSFKNREQLAQLDRFSLSGADRFLRSSSLVLLQFFTDHRPVRSLNSFFASIYAVDVLAVPLLTTVTRASCAIHYSRKNEVPSDISCNSTVLQCKMCKIQLTNRKLGILIQIHLIRTFNKIK